MEKNCCQLPIFITSAGRSGSTFLAKLINNHPDIVCISDLFEPVGPAPFFDREKKITGPAFYDIITAPSTKPRLRYWRERSTTERLFIPDEDVPVSLLLSYTLPFVDSDPMSCLRSLKVYCDGLDPQTTADHLVGFFDWMRDRYGGSIWVERTGGGLGLTEKIIKTWPDAKIIHNYRDGRECSISMLNYPFFRMYLKMLDNPDLDEWDFDELPPIGDVGKLWSDWVILAENAMLKVHESKKSWLAYEDLMSQPKDTLAQLIMFLFEKENLSKSDDIWLEKCLRDIKPSQIKYERLTSWEQEELLSACLPGLKRLGYLS